MRQYGLVQVSSIKFLAPVASESRRFFAPTAHQQQHQQQQPFTSDPRQKPEFPACQRVSCSAFEKILCTCAALLHVAGVVPLFELSLSVVGVSQPVSRRLHPRAAPLHLCSCQFRFRSPGRLALRLSGFPAQSARERRTATCASTKPANRQLSENPGEEGSADSRHPDPAPGVSWPCASL